MTHTAWVLLAAAAMLPGLIGVVLPAVPGIPLMLGVAVIFGLGDGFRHLTGWELLILFLLTLLSIGADYLSGMFGARYGGASGRSILTGMAGMLLGTIILPPFGGIIGMFLAVALTEAAQRKGGSRALRAAAGSVIGSLAGMAISLVIGILFLVCFLIFAWR